MKKPLIDSLENIIKVKLSDLLGKEEKKDKLDLERYEDLAELKRDEQLER